MSKTRVESISLDLIDDNPEYNKRTSLGDTTDLKNSIATHGVKQPVTVKPHRRGGNFRLIAGFRRVFAAREAGLTEIPCCVEPKSTTAVQMVLLNLSENVQREELPPLDEAEGYQDLVKRGMSLPDICKAMGKSRTYIERRIGLLQLSDVIKEAVKEGRVGVTAAFDINRLPSEYHAKYVVVAEEFASAKLRNKVDTELARIEARANPGLPTDDQKTKDAAKAAHEAACEEFLAEVGDMAVRYAEGQVPYLHVVDVSEMELATLRVLTEVLKGCRKCHHPDEERREASSQAAPDGGDGEQSTDGGDGEQSTDGGDGDGKVVEFPKTAVLDEDAGGDEAFPDRE